jgi:hypothetical protein
MDVEPMKSQTAITDPKKAYEVHGFRDDGSVFTVEIIEAFDDHEATRLASSYCKLWDRPVILYQVPASAGSIGQGSRCVSSADLLHERTSA